MIISSHLHFRRYPPIYPNITPRYYISDSLYTLHRLWRPFLHLFQWTYTMLTIQQIPCKPNVVLLSIILHLPEPASGLIGWSERSWKVWMSMFCLTKLAQLVGRFQHLESRNIPFLNPCWWLDCSGESIWWVYCSLVPPKKGTCHLAVFLFATMSPGYTESNTDRLVNCKAGWVSPDSIKKHMFFKKGSWTVRTSIQQQYHFPICKDGEENGLHGCLAMLYFHP